MRSSRLYNKQRACHLQLDAIDDLGTLRYLVVKAPRMVLLLRHPIQTPATFLLNCCFGGVDQCQPATLTAAGGLHVDVIQIT